MDILVPGLQWMSESRMKYANAQLHVAVRFVSHVAGPLHLLATAATPLGSRLHVPTSIDHWVTVIPSCWHCKHKRRATALNKMTKVRDVTSPQDFDAAVASGAAVRIFSTCLSCLNQLGTSTLMQMS